MKYIRIDTDFIVVEADAGHEQCEVIPRYAVQGGENVVGHMHEAFNGSVHRK